MTRFENIPIEVTPRLLREAERWRNSRKPAAIVTPGPGQRSVWDFPRPPAVERVLDRVTVEFGGRVIGDTNRCLRVCETASPPTYYLPRTDMAVDCLRASVGQSGCEWKGYASYYDLVAGSAVSRQAAWWYPNVNVEYQVLTDYIAVYASRVDRCTVAGEVVTPQPGTFYAGWVTSELVGPWKGQPGTRGW